MGQLHLLKLGPQPYDIMDPQRTEQTREYEAQPQIKLQADVDGSGYVHLSSFVLCDTPKDIPIIWVHRNHVDSHGKYVSAQMEVINRRRISTATKWKTQRKQVVNSKQSMQQARRKARDEKYGFIESQAWLDPFKVQIEPSADLKEMVDGFKQQLFDTFGNLSGRVVDTTDTIRDSLCASLQSVAGHVNSFLDAAKNIFWLIPVIGLVCYVATRPESAPLATAFVGVLALLIPSPLKPLMDRVVNYIRQPDIQSQSGFIDGKGILSIVSFGTALMALGGSLRHMSLLDDFGSIVSKVNHDISKRSGFIASTIMIIEETLNAVLKLFGKDKMCILRSGEKEVDKWCDRVSDVTRNFSLCEKDLTGETVSSLRALRNEAVLLEEAYRFDKSVSNVLQSYLQKLDMVCRANAAAFNAHESVRPEPVCLCLYSKPGNGKTIMCNVASTMVMAKTMSAERIAANNKDFKKEIFQKGSSQYWEGYCGQFVYVMDDLMQSVDSVGEKDTEAMDIIRAINTWMYPLNMANAEGKGKHNFTSRFIMATTNVANLGQAVRKVVQEPGAVMRRLHHPYSLVVNTEFCKPGKTGTEESALDTVKLSQYIEQHGTVPIDAWSFQKFDYNTGKVDVTHKPIKLEELVDIICADLKSKDLQFTGIQKPLNNLIDKILMERGIQSQAGVPSPESLLRPGFMSAPQQMHVVLTGETPMDAMKALKEGLDGVRRGMKNAIWHPLKFAEQNPIISTLLGISSLGIFFTLARFALSSLCKYIFGDENKAIESQVVDYRTLQDLSNKKDLPTDIQNSVGKNLFHVTVVDEGNKWHVPLGSAVAIVHKTFMFPHHYMTVMREMSMVTPKTIVHFRNVHNNEFNVEFLLSEFMQYESIEKPEDDLCFMKLPVNMACADILNKFIVEADLHKLKNAFNCMLACAKTVPHSVTRAVMYGKASRFDSYTVDNSKRTVTRGFKYDIPTENGDCGGLLMVGSNVTWTGGRKITGIHSAGAPALGKGFSTIVTAEMVTKALEQFKEVRDTDLPHDVQDQCNEFPVKGSFMPLYTVKKQTTMPPNSKLFRTPLYGEWGPNTRYPAHLRSFYDEEGIEIKPMVNALEKYSGPVKIYTMDDIKDCSWVAWKCVTDATKDIPRKIYTFEEACVGDETNPLFRSMPRRTSAGYPFSCYGASGKTDFFGKGEEFDLDNENCQWLREYVDEIISNARERKRMFHVFNDFLKDERRTKEKNDKGATRLVSGAPLGYVIAFRQYFGCFCTALMECRIESGCAAGVNVYQEWGVVRDYLMNKSSRVVAGDYSAFDSSEQPQIHDAILKFINEWYDDGEVNATIREVLWLDLVNSRHVGGDGKMNNIVYAWFHSLPSGHPGTTAINSLYNLFNFALCWKKIMGLENLPKFNTHVRAVVLGDDNVVAITPEATPKFNQHTITSAMSEIHMTYTTEAKDDTVVAPYRSIDQVSFLKREWRDENGHVFGPLAMASILEMPYWCRDKLNVEEITMSNFETALMELSAHPQEVWDEWAPKMVTAYEVHGYKTAVPPERRVYQTMFKHMTNTYF